MTTDDRGPAPQWPDPSLWPSDDDSNRVWAQFYRDHLGLIVLPMPGLLDVISHASSLTRRAVVDYIDDHGTEPDDETHQIIWDEARKIAEAAAKGPIGYIDRSRYQSASDVTDEVLDLWFVPLEHSRGPCSEADRRPICFLPGRSSKGLPLVLVDADVGHGDKEEADLDGPWGRGLPGPKASTPRGGLHTLMLSRGGERSSQGALAPGVDVVGLGGTPIPLPSGSLATPGRRWLDRSPPAPAPDDLRKPVRRQHRRPDRPQHDRPRGPGDDLDDELGQVAAIIAEPTGTSPGARNAGAGAIVGMLARPRSCPPDFVRACLELLAEESASRDRPSAAHVEEQARWHHALTRGPRDADFAAEVLAAWIRVRDEGRPAWSESKAERVARSLWKTSDWREGEQAGAEDLGVGPPVSSWPTSFWGPRPEPSQPPPPPEPDDDVVHATASNDHWRQQQQQDAGDDAVPYPEPSPEVAAAAVQASKPAARVEAQWRGGIDPRTYLRTLQEQYTDDDITSDEERSPIRIDKVFPAMDFVTGEWLEDKPEAKKTSLYHGWGEHLGRDLGGLAPRDFRVIGATGAGAGKTWFEGWLAHGLAFATAARIIGYKGFEDAPLVLPVWLTEMPKPGELFLRAAACHLGVPMDVVTEGTGAASSPRVVQFASRLKGGWTPEEVVVRGREMLRRFGSDERYAFAFARRHVIRALAIASLPRVTRHRGVAYDHRGGVGIVDHLADAIDVAREDLARLAGVSVDKVLPLALIDPGQRFTSSTESSEKRAIDGLFEAIRQTLCLEVGAAVIATSDTTKAAARESSTIDTFLSTPTGKLGADIFAGSQAIQHQADCIALQAEPGKPGSGTTRTWVRTFKSRGGGSTDVAYPFTWEMGLGRFTPDPPESLRPPPEQDKPERGRGRPAETRGGLRPFMPEGVRLPPLRGRPVGDLQD